MLSHSFLHSPPFSEEEAKRKLWQLSQINRVHTEGTPAMVHIYVLVLPNGFNI